MVGGRPPRGRGGGSGLPRSVALQGNPSGTPYQSNDGTPQWAYTVERLSGRLGEDLKGGKGPEPLLEWLKTVSEAMALEEAGQPVDSELLERLEILRRGAVPFMEGGS